MAPRLVVVACGTTIFLVRTAECLRFNALWTWFSACLWLSSGLMVRTASIASSVLMPWLPRSRRRMVSARSCSSSSASSAFRPLAAPSLRRLGSPFSPQTYLLNVSGAMPRDFANAVFFT